MITGKTQLRESSVARSSNKSNKHATGEHNRGGNNLIVGSLNKSNKEVTREHEESSVTKSLNKSNKHSYCYT